MSKIFTDHLFHEGIENFIRNKNNVYTTKTNFNKNKNEDEFLSTTNFTKKGSVDMNANTNYTNFYVDKSDNNSKIRENSPRKSQPVYYI